MKTVILFVRLIGITLENTTPLYNFLKNNTTLQLL